MWQEGNFLHGLCFKTDLVSAAPQRKVSPFGLKSFIMAESFRCLMIIRLCSVTIKQLTARDDSVFTGGAASLCVNKSGQEGSAGGGRRAVRSAERWRMGDGS